MNIILYFGVEQSERATGKGDSGCCAHGQCERERRRVEGGREREGGPVRGRGRCIRYKVVH